MISFLGPPLEEGPLPALVYLALSKEATLHQDPYNQPIIPLKSKRMRIFSFSLPFHGPDLNPIEAIPKWAKSFELGRDPITPFLDQTAEAIQALIEQKQINRLALMGLSRGGLLAAHLAIRLPTVAWVGFAPVTKLTKVQEFEILQKNPKIEQFDLDHLLIELSRIPMRLYIGNRDLRVGTRHCFTFVEALTNQAFALGIRSPPVELIISPSIGNMGHGTSREVFYSGAEWIANQLGVA